MPDVLEEVQPRPMVDVLRELAEVMEANSIEVEWLSLSVYKQNLCGAVVVDLLESDFKRLFAGIVLTGSREGSFVRVQIEKYGFLWKSQLYRPSPRLNEFVEVQL